MEELAIDLSQLGLDEYINLQLSGSGPVSFRRCIYQVPERLRRIREEAYTPRLVSIGPLHRGTISLQKSEQVKIEYVNSYFSNFRDSDRGNFIEAAKSWEKRARACYDDTRKLSSNEFIYMTLVDGIFIVEFLVKNVYPARRERDDEIFQHEWVCKEILHDMMLLENQLPFFVIEYLFDRVKEACRLDINLLNLVCKVFQRPIQLRVRPIRFSEIYHLVDIFYLNIFIAPSLGVKQGGKLVDNSTATELKEAGVKFVKVERECLHDIEFDNKTGELKIPCLVVNQWTYSLLGNLNAFEQYQYNGTLISSYIILMDNLMDTPADVDILVASGIIETQSSSEDVCTLFNNLYKRTASDDHKFYFTSLCTDLKNYSRDYWHQWKAKLYKWKHILKHKYFSDPWTIISVFAAFILLSLTAIQTAYAIKG